LSVQSLISRINPLAKFEELGLGQWKHQLAALFLLGIVFFFSGLGNGKLWDQDETTYAQVAREMIQTGDWVVPRYDGELLAHKPPLSYWAMILGSRLFGMNELGMRFFSAVSGLACVLVVFVLGRRMFDPQTGFLAGLILLSSPFFPIVCRSALMDAHLTLFVTCALWGFWEALRNPPGSLLWILFCGVTTGLAVLVKGPLGLLLVGSAGFFTLLATRRFRQLPKLHPVAGLSVFLFVASLWYVVITWKTGWGFLYEFILRENLDKVFKPTLGHGGPIWYYFPVLLLAFVPWSLFLPTALKSLWKRSWEEKGFLLSWAVIPFIFFSMLGTKLPHYILPVFPALALITAQGLARSAQDDRNPPGFVRYGLFGLGTILLGTGLVAWVLLPDLAGWRLPLTLLPLWLGWTIAMRRPSRYRLTQPHLVISMLLFILLAAHVMVPHLDGFRVVHQAAGGAALWAEKQTGQGRKPRLFAHRYREPGMLFYSAKHIPEVGDRGLTEALDLPGPVLVIARKKYYEEMPQELRARFQVKQEFEGFCENKGPMTLLLLEAVDRHRTVMEADYESR